MSGFNQERNVDVLLQQMTQLQRQVNTLIQERQVASNEDVSEDTPEEMDTTSCDEIIKRKIIEATDKKQET